MITTSVPTLAVGVLVAGAVTVGTAELLAASEAPAGFVLTTDELTTLGFDEFADASPYSVGHVDPGSPEEDSLRAGLDAWNQDDDVLLREVSVWSSGDVAAEFVDEIVQFAAEEGLTTTTPPFDGAQAFAGFDDEDGIAERIVVWRHGSIGATISHLRDGPDIGSSIAREASQAFADGIAATAGIPVTGSADDAATGSSSDSGSGSGGGIPIGRVLLWVAIIGVAIFAFVKLRRKLRGGAERGERRSREVDDIIAETRARTRDERGDAAAPPERSTDDIIAEARRRARDEVEQASGASSDDWEMPDDY